MKKYTQEGDLVLLRKRKKDKLSPHYERKSFQMIARHGAQVQSKFAQDLEYVGKIQNVKLFVSRDMKPRELNLTDPACREPACRLLDNKVHAARLWEPWRGPVEDRRN